MLAFQVTLDRARHAQVTVDYATVDDTATAGADYTAASGTLTFAPGQISKTVNVTVLDDAHDEDSETMKPQALEPRRGEASKTAVGIGTITNTDHMPQAWLARFGRTFAEQIWDAGEERVRSSPGRHDQDSQSLATRSEQAGSWRAPGRTVRASGEGSTRRPGTR